MRLDRLDDDMILALAEQFEVVEQDPRERRRAVVRKLAEEVGAWADSEQAGAPAEPFPPLLALALELPFPVALVLSEYAGERDPFRRLHRLSDAAELITRFLAIVLLSELHRDGGAFPPALRRLLADTLERPSFGAWKEIAAAAGRGLPRVAEGIRCCISELPPYLEETLLPALGSGADEPERAIIALRNLLAHAGRLSEPQAKELLAAHEERFAAFAGGLSFLARYPLLARDEQERLLELRGPEERFSEFQGSLPGELPPGRVFLLCGQQPLDLFPLQLFADVLAWRERPGEPLPAAQLYFRGGTGHLEFTALSERASFAQHAGEPLARFRELFALADWRREKGERARGDDAFGELMAELTEVFVGREDLLRHIKEELRRRESGLLWLAGKPGVGKSALLAKLARDLQGGARDLLVLPYFFRAGHAGSSGEEFLRFSLRALATALGQAPVLPPDPEGRRRLFLELLSGASAASGKKLVFLLDGLNELERREPGFLSLLLQARAPGVVWLLAGRPEPELEAALLAGGADVLFPEGLPPLSPSGARALLQAYLGRDKYALFARDEGERNRFLEELALRSQGLPLYLRLVIEDVRRGSLSFRDEDRLPAGLEAYFERELERLQVSDVGTVLTPLFSLLAWAREPVGEPVLALLLSTQPMSRVSGWTELFRRALAHGHLLLRSAPTPEGKPGWALYHESFRDHLLRSESVKGWREWAQEEWLARCSQWQDLSEESLRRYALRHYPAHLLAAVSASDGEQLSSLYALARDEGFLQAQQAELSDDPAVPLRTLEAALEAALARDDAAAIAEFLLARARRLAQIARESPLQVLRAGLLARAWELCDVQEPERSFLWHLLLASELSDAGRREEAHDTLARLREKQLLRLSEPWKCDAAAFLLADLVDLGEEAVAALQRAVLPDYARAGLARRLALRRRDALALQTAGEIGNDEGGRADALLEIATAQAQEGEFAAALETAETIDRDSYRAHALREIATAQAQAGEFAAALETAETIDRDSYRAHALREIATALAKAGEQAGARSTFVAALETAGEIAGEIDDARTRAVALAETAAAQAEAGELAAARGTFAAALELAGEIEDAGSGASALGEIAAAQAQMGELAPALEMAGEIDDEWWRAWALKAIAAAKAKAGELEGARATFAAAPEAAGEIDDEWSRASALEAIAAAQAKAGELEGARATFAAALELVREIEDEWSRASALNAIAAAQAQAGEFARALGTAAAIDREPQRAWALGTIAAAQAQAGELRGALQTAGGIHRMASREKALRAIAAAQVQAGDFTGALETAGKDMALGAIVAAQAQAGELAAARTTIAAALELAGEIEGEGSRASALGEIAAAQAQEGEFAAALETAGEIDDARIRPYALRAIAAAQVQAGQLTAARGTFTAALEVARNIDAKALQAAALGEIAAAQTQAGEFTAALETAGEIDNARTRAYALRAIAAAQVQVGQLAAARATFAAALQTAVQIDDDESYRANALMAIAAAQAQAGEFAAALQTAETIDADFYRAHALTGIATAQAQAGELAAARRTFAAARRTFAAALEMAASRPKALAEVATAQAHVGDLAGARGTFAAALELAGEIEDAGSRASALGEIAAAQAQMGELAPALELAGEIDDEWWRAWALKAIAAAKAKAGELEGARATFAAALEAAGEIDDEWSRASALEAIAAAQAKAGELEGARATFAAALEAAGEVEGATESAFELASIGARQAEAGLHDDAATTAEVFLLNRDVHLPRIARALAERGGRQPFKRVAACCSHFEAAYEMCALLPSLYPEHAAAVARVVAGRPILRHAPLERT